MAFNWITVALSKVLTDRKLDTIIGLLDEARGREDALMATITGLEVKIQELITAVSAAVLLIQGFPARLEAAGVDPAKVAALEQEVATATANITAVVAANAEPV
jgi:hypothetical protein